MQDRENILRRLEQIEPPRALLGNIVMRIIRERRRSARIRLVFWAAGVFVTLTAFVPAAQYAGKEFLQSGFSQYLSLAFSDGGVLMVSWKEFALTLAESLPLIGLTITLALLFALLGSIRLMARDMRIAFYQLI